MAHSILNYILDDTLDKDVGDNNSNDYNDNDNDNHNGDDSHVDDNNNNNDNNYGNTNDDTGDQITIYQKMHFSRAQNNSRSLVNDRAKT